MEKPTEGLSADPPDVFAAVVDALGEVLGPRLVGLYLQGSLVAGGFDPQVSDIDLIAAVSEDPDEALVARLRSMHDSLVRAHPEWDDRIEVVYVSASRLRQVPRPIPRMAVISPGEPLHVVRGGKEWVLSWFPARDEAVALSGPPLAEVLPEIPWNSFAAAVRDQLEALAAGIADDASPGACAYAVLTTCRGIFTLEHGRRPSKAQAAAWAAGRYPDWAEVIDSALRWRRAQWKVRTPDPAAIRDTRRFLEAVRPE